VSDWSLIYNAYDPKQQGIHESLCALGNGYFATRGAFPESKMDDTHYPGTYVGFGYNRLETHVDGKVLEEEDLVNLPNWLVLTFRVGEGEWFSLETVDILSFHQELNMKQGMLYRTVRFRDAEGRISILVERRLVSMHQPHLAALEWSITAENWSGTMTVRTALDGTVINYGVERYKVLSNQHLDPLHSDVLDEETLFLKVQTRQSELRVAQSARTRFFINEAPTSPRRTPTVEPLYVAQDCVLEVSQGDVVRIEKAMAMYTSKDRAMSECGLDSQTTVRRAEGFDTLMERHVREWRILWQHFDMGMVLTDTNRLHHPLMVLRLHIFHLVQTASLHSIGLDIGVPARGWTGEAYRGHIFWDEMFIFPFLNFRRPEISRALLMYRYWRLNEARQRAASEGHRGAIYPWQSGSNGQEETPIQYMNTMSRRWIQDHTYLQRHVNAAVVYSVWQYFQTTEDLEFLNTYGAEIILEVARYWASISTFNEKLGRYEILKVVGPDEFHVQYPDTDEIGVNNNTYTNVMAVWCLGCALKVLDILPHDRRHELCELLELRQEEIAHWEDVSRKMRIVFHQDGIMTQFEGYEDLKELDWEYYHKKYPNNHRMDLILELEKDSANRYKLSKQADLLMLFYLFSANELKELFERMGYPFDTETIPKNVDYYLQRTSHGSTLSRLVHSWVFARSDRAQSWDLFTQALDSDIADIQGGTTREGIHLGAMAGTVDIMQRCYTGMVVREGVLWLEPALPDVMERLHLRVRYRGQSIDLDLRPDKIRIHIGQSSAKDIRIGYDGVVYDLKAGDSLELDGVPMSVS